MPDSSVEVPPKKRRGAPPGNQNALKHGIYSNQLKQRELSGTDLSTVALGDEITAMRFFIRRLIASSADVTERRKLFDLLHELSLGMLTPASTLAPPPGPHPALGRQR